MYGEQSGEYAVLYQGLKGYNIKMGRSQEGTFCSRDNLSNPGGQILSVLSCKLWTVSHTQCLNKVEFSVKPVIVSYLTKSPRWFIASLYL